MKFNEIIFALILFLSCRGSDSRVQPPVTVMVERAILPAVIIEDRIGYGETLSAILRKHGLTPPVSQEIIAGFQSIYNVKSLKPHETYVIGKDSSGGFMKFCYRPVIEREYVVFSDSSGTIRTRVDEIRLEKKICRLEGDIATTLYDAVLALGETPELLVAFSDIFQWDVDFFIDPRVGDEFRIIYEAYYLPLDSIKMQTDRERFVRYGRILAGRYTLQGNELTAIYFDNSPGDDGYYALNGESFQKTFLKSPLNYRRISSHFSYSRRHPILKIVRPHYGVDFAAPLGTPVSATADGEIIDRGYDSGIGNFVKIRHKNPRFVTLYGHLSRFADGMVKGKVVQQKEVVGYVGKTGLATGPHLHYTFYEGGRPIDPMKIKNTSGDPIHPDHMVQFEAVKADMLAQLNFFDEREIPLLHNVAMLVRINRYLIAEP